MKQLQRILLLAATFVQCLLGQLDQRAASPSVSPAEAENRFRLTIRLGLPKSSLTEVSIYVLNRSDLAVPVLIAEISDRLDRNAEPEFVTTASELIAYAADYKAIDGIDALIGRDEHRFAPYVKRTLDHAINRKRGFEVAFYAVETHPTLRPLVAKWMQGVLEFPQSGEIFAGAILDREKYGIPRDRNEGLLGLLDADVRQRVGEAVERVRKQERDRPVR